jgi:hypothetical protein
LSVREFEILEKLAIKYGAHMIFKPWTRKKPRNKIFKTEGHESLDRDLNTDIHKYMRASQAGVALRPSWKFFVGTVFRVHWDRRVIVEGWWIGLVAFSVWADCVNGFLSI